MSNGNLIINTPIRYLSSKDCPFTIGGENLVTFRRAKLRQIAKSLQVSAADSKQDILKRIIGALKVSGAPSELNDL